MPAYTLLAIDGIDFSQYAVRGITMTLTPISQAANLARDCRGGLADISLAQFRQHKVSITCTDHEAPELTDVWPGMDVTITCIPGLGAANTHRRRADNPRQGDGMEHLARRVGRRGGVDARGRAAGAMKRSTRPLLAMGGALSKNRSWSDQARPSGRWIRR